MRGRLSVLELESRITPTTFTVNQLGDDLVGDPVTRSGTLRWCIAQANNDLVPDTIAFNIPASDVPTIYLGSEIDITSPVVIDGYTQPGALANADKNISTATIPVKVLRDVNAPVDTDGLVVTGVYAHGTTIKGLVVGGFRTGIWLDAFYGNNVVSGCFIGIDSDGTTIRPNQYGVWVEGYSNRIGGVTPQDRNVISGNGVGVTISGSGTRFNVVAGNLIGTTAAGTKKAVLDGTPTGVWIRDGANQNTIGGSDANSRNVISGNLTGVYVGHNAARDSALGLGTTWVVDSNYIRGNYIGTDWVGTTIVANNVGVLVREASNNEITDNVITGNEREGVSISEIAARLPAPSLTTGNKVLRNIIGLAAGGLLAPIGGFGGRGNGTGVFISGVSGNTVGTDDANDKNVISNNGWGITIGAAPNSLLTNNNTVGINIIGGNIFARPFGRVGNIFGVLLVGPGAQNNTIKGSKIIFQNGNAVERNADGPGNVISFNSIFGNAGHAIAAINSVGGSIVGNYLGTDETGAVGLGNGDDAVFVQASSDILIAGNTITGSDGNAVRVVSGYRIAMLNNSMYLNGDIDIDLNGDGSSANDRQDPDGNANYTQNTVVLSPSDDQSNSLDVFLDSTPNKTFYL